MALFALSNPRFDYGIHLTLTCEWENYRFGPVLPVSEVPGLVDINGFFYRTRKELREHAHPDEVARELQAQMEKALSLGLTPSHIDSHMYSIGADPEFFRVYKELGRKFNLPVLVNKQLMEMVGLNPSEHLEFGDVNIDHCYVGEWDYFRKGKLSEFYSNALDNLSVGVNLILIHPAYDDDEMRGITVNHPNFGSEWRQVDLDFFTNEENRLKLEKSNIHVISWKDLRSL